MISLLNSARLVAIGRLALALSLLMLAVTDPGHGGFEWEPDDTISLAYLLAALAAAVIAWRDWWPDHRLRGWFVALDLLIFILLPSLIEPLVEGYRIAALTAATFIELSVALRWNWRIAGIAAIVINLLNWLLTTYRPVASMWGYIPTAIVQVEHTDYIRSIYYLLLISLLIVWVGSRLSVPLAPRFVPSRNASGPAFLDEALSYGLAISHGGKGILTWQRADRASAPQVLARPQVDPALLAEIASQARTAKAGLPMLFDLRRYRAITAADSDLTAGPVPDEPGALIKAAGNRSAFLVPIEGVSGRGHLLVSDASAPSTDMLRMLATAGKEIADAADRQQASRLEREESFARLRQKLARDLHDSVAQSLAGTRFWLQNLGRKGELPPDVVTELEKIDHALDSESEHLRQVISRLRQDAQEFDGDPLQDLADLAKLLGEQWHIDVRLQCASGLSGITTYLAFELAQIIREGVSNAVRHGKASEVVVMLKSDGDWLFITIRDNGTGFPESPTSNLPRMLSQRLDELGGSLDVLSSENGTQLAIMLPMKDIE